MIKKLAVVALALLLALGCVLPAFAGGADEYSEVISLEEAMRELPVAAAVAPGKLPVRSAILIEQSTGRVLYEENADERLPPASITKVMTMLLTIEAVEAGKLSLDEPVQTSEHASSMGGTQIWLKVGEQMTVHDLLKAVATVSANDASVALAEKIGGSEQGFAELMNRRAAQLGMSNTSFVNASGLDAAGHLTTARDIAIMSRELLSHPLTTEYTTIWMDSLRGGETQLVNTNRLVRFYEGATGLKTGTTSGAGHCLAASAERGGLGLVAVVMGSSTGDERFSAGRGLLDYGFGNYTAVTPPDISDRLTPVKVLGGDAESVCPTYKSPPAIVVRKADKENITHDITLAQDLQAPVEPGQVVGSVEVRVGSEAVGSYPLVAAEGVAEMTLWRAFCKLVAAAVKMYND